jgi:MFS family permease
VAHQTDDNAPPSIGRVLGRWLADAFRWLWRRLRGEVIELVGGPARARVIVLFGAVLALSGADAATVGAVAPQLEHALHIGNAKVGLLSSVALLVGAVFTIPVGLLVDRVQRMPLLSVSIILWSLASLLSAFAGSYSSLLISRILLGAVTATAGPAIASLAGDYFPARERGRVYAYILGGETAGTAVGFIVSGTFASVFTWRAAFVLLAIPGFFLARELWRTVPEPGRGGQSFLEPGALEIKPAPRTPPTPKPSVEDEPATDEASADLAREAARRLGVQPAAERVLHTDPGRMGIVDAVRYTLKVPTNVFLIVGSTLGYFYFAGLQTFALLFVRGHFHASQAQAEFGLALLVLGALVGTLVSGYVTDAMLKRGVLQARMLIPAVCYLAAAVFFIPGILGSHFYPAVWFDVAGAALVSAANPPLQAARLDIMPARLWGRAESARTLFRSLGQAVAPLAFGGIADLVAGFLPTPPPIGSIHNRHPGLVSSNAATGLEVSFMVMLATLAVAGVVLLRSRHTYATDVVTAEASQEAVAAAQAREPAPSPAEDAAPAV